MNEDYNDPNQDQQDQYDPYAQNKWAVGEWYKNYLGRQGSEQEINGWATNANFGGVENSIKNSPEAQAWTKSQTPATANAPQAPASNPFNYEAARDSWMSGQYGQGQAGAKAWAAANGVNYNGGDTIMLPNGGGYIDIISNFAGGKGNGQAMGNTWTAAGGNGNNPNGVPKGTGYPTFGPSNPNGQPVDPALQARNDELWKMLMDRSKQGLAIDRNDPIIRGQADAFTANQDRARRNYLGDQAESSSPYATGAMRGQERMTAEKVGQATGGFEAELMGRELTARRAEIAQGLEGMRGMLTTDQTLALQKELGYLDNAIKQQQIEVQRHGQDLDWQRAMMQNDQFLADLGFRSDDRSSYWDAIRSGLLNN